MEGKRPKPSERMYATDWLNLSSGVLVVLGARSDVHAKVENSVGEFDARALWCVFVDVSL